MNKLHGNVVDESTTTDGNPRFVLSNPNIRTVEL
jgi:hypothetical protein